MSKCDDGGAAFPGMMHHDETGYGGGVSYTPEGGMSLRDYFAAKAMQALLANSSISEAVNDRDVVVIVDASFKVADAMLAARKETP